MAPLKQTRASMKASSAPKKPKSHPPYGEMITEAIVVLKERTGSSQIAIAKFIEEKQKNNLPPNFKKLLLVQLKKLVADEKLVKVKNSYKLPPKTSPAASKPKPKNPAKTKPVESPKKKKTPVKVVKKPKSIKSPVKKVAVKKAKK